MSIAVWVESSAETSAVTEETVPASVTMALDHDGIAIFMALSGAVTVTTGSVLSTVSISTAVSISPPRLTLTVYVPSRAPAATGNAAGVSTRISQ